MQDQPQKGSTTLRRYVVMGVSGTGKSEIGRRLAKRLDITFVEGDEFHSPANIAKMAAGMPLNDQDRHEWLLALQSVIGRATQGNEGMVLTCSALKRRYRDMLRVGDPTLVFIHLHGDTALISARMKQRMGHFMPEALLESQLRDLEPPGADECAIHVDIACEPDDIVDQIVRRIVAI